MNNKTKKFLEILLLFLILSFVILLGIYIGENIQNKNLIKKVSKTYTENIDIQDKNDKAKDVEEVKIEIDGKSILGILKIEKINFEGLVYEGTDSQILNKGVGHFEQTPILEGNPCFAAHNYYKYWAKLHNLKNGDSISYISYLGIKNYEVNKIVEISEKDWSLLKNTDENIITLITCIKNQPEKRLCVQAKEKK